jgi:hypothetical protein
VKNSIFEAFTQVWRTLRGISVQITMRLVEMVTDGGITMLFRLLIIILL